jgi:hypothetical protein
MHCNFPLCLCFGKIIRHPMSIFTSHRYAGLEFHREDDTLVTRKHDIVPGTVIRLVREAKQANKTNNSLLI